MDLSTLPVGFTVKHDNFYVIGTNSIRGYGLPGKIPRYDFINLDNELAFIDYIAARERFFDWDGQFPEGTTDFTQHNAEQTTHAVIFIGRKRIITMMKFCAHLLSDFSVGKCAILDIPMTRLMILECDATNTLLMS